jgi:orotidine-5'-phosphate decarboxylase
MTGKCGLLVNSSRAIIFADSSAKYAATAAEKAREVRDEMQLHLSARNIL